jgi:hypothetical protein
MSEGKRTYLAYGTNTIKTPKPTEKRDYPPIVITKEILLEYGLVSMAAAVEKGATITLTYSDDE